MSEFIFKMPDLGEGTVEAEIVAWHTQPGAEVAEDQIIVEVMTDKAAVEVPAPVSGRVVSITRCARRQDRSGLAVDRVRDRRRAAPPRRRSACGEPPRRAPRRRLPRRRPRGRRSPPPRWLPRRPRPARGRIMASPANRRRAREAGIDLATVAGSGPGGRIVREDLEAASTPSDAAATPRCDRTLPVPRAAASAAARPPKSR